jgi:lipid A 3-O-deacylase
MRTDSGADTGTGGIIRPVSIRLIPALLYCLSLSVAAIEPPPQGSELQLFVENDMLAHTDRYYSNGFKLGVGLPFDLIQAPAADLLRSISPDASNGAHLGLFLGQNLYTPRDITIAAAQPYDRPWAAWLYLGGVAQRAIGDRLHTVEFDLGVIGPAALGKEVQSNWHHLIGVRQPKGWSNQGGSEPAFLVSYLQKRRYGNDSVDVVAHGGVTVGTVMTLARGGAMLRLGQRMSGFGPDTIEPGGAMLQGTRASGAASRAGSEWYVFAGVDHRLVAYNIFLDGPVFRDGPSVDRRPHVWDLAGGFSFRIDGLRFSWTRIRRSEEFHTSHGGGGTQRFDSLNLGVEF